MSAVAALWRRKGVKIVLMNDERMNGATPSTRLSTFRLSEDTILHLDPVPLLRNRAQTRGTRFANLPLIRGCLSSCRHYPWVIVPMPYYHFRISSAKQRERQQTQSVGDHASQVGNHAIRLPQIARWSEVRASEQSMFLIPALMSQKK